MTDPARFSFRSWTIVVFLGLPLVSCSDGSTGSTTGSAAVGPGTTTATAAVGSTGATSAAPDGVADAPDADGPARFLGNTKSKVEGAVSALSDEPINGWVAYDPRWSLRFEGECAVEVRMWLNGEEGCDAGLAGLGFVGAGPASPTDDACTWPEGSLKHPKAANLTVRLDLRTRTALVQLVGDGRKCD